MSIILRAIPGTLERLPVIGCGTYVGFDCKPGSPAYARLPAVLDTLQGGGGHVLDSSPMYGRAETTTGELLAARGGPGDFFIATKVWTRGREEGVRQMRQSMGRLGIDTVDLMQIHNLVDWRVHLKTLREWKAAGRVRHIGITHYTASAYAEVEAVMREARPDFLQINYSMDSPEAAQRILPLAQALGMGVLVNMPLGGAGVARRMQLRSLPGWAADIGCSNWAQVMLKFALGHPAVTCVIPGSSSPQHMEANVAAGSGVMPEAGFWAGKSLN